MSLADLTRAAVLRAIEEFDHLGRDAFLVRYSFGRARSYFLVHDGRRYDSKAIVGAAHGYLEGRRPLRPEDFSGGDRTVKARLNQLGFTIEPSREETTRGRPGAALGDPSFPPVIVPSLLGVAEPQRWAARRVGRRYEFADENPSRSPVLPFEVDPEMVNRGHRAHAISQNALAKYLIQQGIEPRSPDPLHHEPAFDVAWEVCERVYVAEVKSVTESNEETQLRLGLGQVLRYRHQLRTADQEVVGVLVTERAPTDQTWPVLCGELKIILAWTGSFELISRHWCSTSR